MPNVLRAVTNENGESPYGVTISVSGHLIKGDEPVSAGGGNTGPAPYDLLAAALGECTCMTVRMYAEKQNWPLEEVEVIVEFHKERMEGHRYPVDVFEKRVLLRGPDLTAEQREKLLEISAKGPVHRTFENTPMIRTSEAPGSH
ncbi:MAG: OsmC family protein [Alphaproteobacteria bacterium]|nr:OsmC family protein [Alphaproteobacteria bacterium]